MQYFPDTFSAAQILAGKTGMPDKILAAQGATFPGKSTFLGKIRNTLFSKGRELTVILWSCQYGILRNSDQCIARRGF